MFKLARVAINSNDYLEEFFCASIHWESNDDTGRPIEHGRHGPGGVGIRRRSGMMIAPPWGTKLEACSAGGARRICRHDGEISAGDALAHPPAPIIASRYRQYLNETVTP
ncbi:hypothetical protein [Sphingopyxis granuli]|uniref:hypothetical protein n=1 Tax=Sphingopyxis granuli TaxID=267128 RepID=UPI0012E7908F|nr:hypothetical protein [Sphingopyxis granuli]